MKTFISVVVATIGAAGCTTMAMESERYYANRVATDKAQKQAIVDAVSEFMGGKSITLADDVFINEHSMGTWVFWFRLTDKLKISWR